MFDSNRLSVPVLAFGGSLCKCRYWRLLGDTRGCTSVKKEKTISFSFHFAPSPGHRIEEGRAGSSGLRIEKGSGMA